jgi:serine protease Do
VGKRKQFAVKLGELESGSVAASPASTSSKDLGMTLRTLTPNVARELELDPDARGVAVVSVEAGSAADKAGVQAGDVILSVQGKPVESVEEFRAELRKQDVKRDGVRLKLGRGDAKLYVLILEDRG